MFSDDSNDLSPLLLMQMLGKGGMGMKSLGGMHPMMLLHLKNSKYQVNEIIINDYVLQVEESRPVKCSGL